MSISSPPENVTIRQGDAIDFQGKTTGGTAPYQYRWIFGNGITSDLEDPGNTAFDTPGIYTVTLIVTDATEATASASVVITVTDTMPPTVISTVPEDGAVGVDTHAPVSVTFSENMDPETLTESTFTVSTGGTLIPGTVSISGSVSVFTPAAPLIQGITYTATVTTGAKDLQGNALASDYTWTFTTLKSIAAGGAHTLTIQPDGSLWAWGSNASGQLGIESDETVNLPQPVMPGNWAAVSAGKDHSLALKNDGSLWAWGSNSSGQLGVSNSNIQYTPLQVSPGVKWTMVSAGWYHTLAIRPDGSLWAWGSNVHGQLGTGNQAVTRSNIPVRIGQANDWLFVAAGQYHSLAIKKDGSLWAWGNNSAGQLGNGDAGNAAQYSPVLVDSGKWITAAAGCIVEDFRSHSLGVKADGSLWSWGWNQYGQLGDGTYVNKNIPNRVGNEYDWTAVSAGGKHSLALKKDGSLWAWGYNEYGQLGDGSFVTRNHPVPVTSEWTWAAASAGNEHSAGLGSDGTIFTWGRNASGQLGDGSYEGANIPLQISDNEY